MFGRRFDSAHLHKVVLGEKIDAELYAERRGFCVFLLRVAGCVLLVK
jgi:hypothetical protein